MNCTMQSEEHKDTARHILHHLMTVGENSVQIKCFDVMWIEY